MDHKLLQTIRNLEAYSKLNKNVNFWRVHIHPYAITFLLGASPNDAYRKLKERILPAASPYIKSSDSVCHRVLHDPSQTLPPVLVYDVPHAGRKVQQAPLRDRPLHERTDVPFRIPHSLQTPRNVQPVEELRDGLEEVSTNRGLWDFRDCRVGWGDTAEDGQRLAVPLGRGWGGELEDSRRGERDAVYGVQISPVCLVEVDSWLTLTRYHEG